MINRWTDICVGSGSRGRSCSKICLVKVFMAGDPENFLKTYAVLDDQSNQSLGHSELFDDFNVPNNLVLMNSKPALELRQPGLGMSGI